MENDSPPYLTEYAKSNRAMCKSCSSHIAKDSLRIALMVQSRHFDGKVFQCGLLVMLICIFKSTSILIYL